MVMRVCVVSALRNFSISSASSGRAFWKADQSIVPFTANVLLAIASAKLSFTNLKDADSLGVRLMPALLLFALPETMMEAFLFVEISLNVIWVWFLFTAGFVFRMQKSE